MRVNDKPPPSVSPTRQQLLDAKQRAWESAMEYAAKLVEPQPHEDLPPEVRRELRNRAEVIRSMKGAP